MDRAKPNAAFTIFILGAMAALGPFSIDMYLPAFPQIAKDLGTTSAEVALSLSSYFAGVAVGQLAYGPLLDRYGRKKPVYFGLVLYMLAALGCMASHSTEALIAARLVQGLGGCAAGVGATAMVRDLFSVKESSKVFSLLMLVIAASPLLAPTTGSYIAVNFGWHAVFLVLVGLALMTLAATIWLLPDTAANDHSVTLRLGPIIRTYLTIGRDPQFYTFTFCGGLSLAGLFVYVASSPVLFLEIYQVDAKVYGWIFAFIAAGLIGASQLNILALRRYRPEQILLAGLYSQLAVSLVFFSLAMSGMLALETTIGLLFLILASCGFTLPNATVLAMAPFAKAAGSASALMSSCQMLIGTVASIGIGVLHISGMKPIAALLGGSAFLATLTLQVGRRQIKTLHQDDTLATANVLG